MKTIDTTRRRMLRGLLLPAAAVLFAAAPRVALAEDDGGDSGGDSGGGGSDDGGGGSSGGGKTSGAAGGAAGAHDSQPKDASLAQMLKGKIAGVREIEAIARRTVPGEIVGIRLNRQDARYVYKVRVVRPNGDVVDVLIDAVSRGVVAGKAP